MKTLNIEKQETSKWIETQSISNLITIPEKKH